MRITGRVYQIGGGWEQVRLALPYFDRLLLLPNIL